MNARERRSRWSVAAATSLALALWVTPSAAAGPLGNDGEPLRTSAYKVDLTQTPVLAGSRVTGIAGAYVAIAEGIDGNTQTPVSPAVRPAYSYDAFDYDLGVGVTLTAVLRNTDFFNTGRSTQLDAKQSGFVFLTPALNLTYGNFGLGLTLELQHYELSQNDAPTQNSRATLSADFGVGHIQTAYSLFQQQLTVGVGARIVSLALSESTTGQQELFSTEGAGAELGLLLRPNDERYRIGAAFRSSVTTTARAGDVAPDAQGDRVVGGGAGEIAPLWLPSSVTLPWDINTGFALMLGPKAFNPVWYHDQEGLDSFRLTLVSRRAERRAQAKLWLAKARREGRDEGPLRAALEAEDARQTAMEDDALALLERSLRSELKERNAQRSHSYLLISASVVLTGPVQDAVGVESFLSREVNRSGQRVVVSPRLGMETETVPNWVRVRAGTYGEPSRSAGGRPRVHGTLGMETKVFPWNVFGLWGDDAQWRISGSLDVAKRYLGWGVAIGNWY